MYRCTNFKTSCMNGHWCLKGKCYMKCFMIETTTGSSLSTSNKIDKLTHFETREFPRLGQDHLDCNVHQGLFWYSPSELSLYDLCHQASRVLEKFGCARSWCDFYLALQIFELHVKEDAVLPAEMDLFHMLLCHHPIKDDLIYKSGFYILFVQHLRLEISPEYVKRKVPSHLTCQTRCESTHCCSSHTWSRQGPNCRTSSARFEATIAGLQMIKLPFAGYEDMVNYFLQRRMTSTFVFD